MLSLFSDDCDEIVIFNSTMFGIKIEKKTWCKAYKELKQKSIDKIFKEELFTYNQELSEGEFGDEILILTNNKYDESQKNGFNHLIVKDIVMMRGSPDDSIYKEYGAKFIKRMYMCCLINAYKHMKQSNDKNYYTVDDKAKIDKLSQFYLFCGNFMTHFHEKIYKMSEVVSEEYHVANRIGGKKTKRRRNKKTKSRRRRRHTRN